MEKHHAPRTSKSEYTRPKTVMKETGWSRKEVFEMTMEAWEEGLLGVTIKTSQPRWDWYKFIPTDLQLIQTFSSVWKKQYRRNLGTE